MGKRRASDSLPNNPKRPRAVDEGGEAKEGGAAVGFSPRCDGCHDVFREGAGEDGKAREPVSVGCFHTLCRACAEGNKGAYGALEHLANAKGEGEGESDSRVGVEGRVRALVRGRCAVCGGGKGGEIVVRDVVLQALRRAGGQEGEGEGEGEGEDEDVPEDGATKMCEVCGEEAKHAATHYCEDCEQHMCGVGAKAHKRIKATSEHTVKQSEEGAKPAPAPPLCLKHRRPLSNFFCKEDSCFVCTACMATDHNGHTFVEEGDELVEAVRGWLVDEIGRALAKAGEFDRAEDGLVEDRDRAMASARQAIASINAVFDELERKRERLIGLAVSTRKAVCQRLNDVRTTSRMLLLGVAAARRALHTLALSPSLWSVQRVGHARQQLRQLVEESAAVRTHRGNTEQVFHHSDCKLKAWCESLNVREAGDLEWEARPGSQSLPLPSLNVARCRLAAAVVTPSNHAFVVGGEGSDEEFLGRVERLQGADSGGAWEEGAALAARRCCGACAVGTAVIVAGGDGGDVLDVVEAVDTASGARTLLPPLPQRVASCGVVGVQGKVVVTGGNDESLAVLNTVWALDVGNDVDFQQHQHQHEHEHQALQWTLLPSMAQARGWHGAAAGGGCVFVCGGEGVGSNNELDSCEMLRVAVGGGGDGGEDQGGWEALPPIPKKLSSVGCCYGGGNVFVAGGYPRAQRSVFALNVRERKWAQVAELATRREACAAVCVGRRVMVLGGWNNVNGYLNTCEVLEF